MMNPIPDHRAMIPRNRQRCPAALRDCILCFYGVIVCLSFCYLTPFLLFNFDLPPPKLNPEEDSVYHSEKDFETKYAEMERVMKVFVYPANGRLSSGKFGGEGLFFKNIIESRFLTHDPEKADLFFIPISCHQMRRPKAATYLEELINDYPYWNRTTGSDHFYVDCHDDGGGPLRLHNSIRVVCSSRYDSCYLPHMASRGFWARYRYFTPRAEPRGKELVNARKNEVEIESTYIDPMNGSSSLASLIFKFKTSKSKFFICSAGAHANTVCIAHSIHYGCVPVIMSDYYNLPFNDILNWSKFAVLVRFDNIIQITRILTVISSSEFQELHMNTIKAWKHFQWNSPPNKYDAFHTLMHEIWLEYYVDEL